MKTNRHEPREIKQYKTITMSPTARRFLERMARSDGISQSSWIEMKIRELARERGMTEPAKN